MNNRNIFIYRYFYTQGKIVSELPICQTKIINQPLTSINTRVDSDNIIQKVDFIKNKFNNITNSKKIVERISGINDVLNEPRTTIKSILTDFVVEDITLVDSAPILIYILNNLCRGFFSSLREKTGEDYRLIYKGGNVIKIYFDDFVNNFFDSSLKPEIYTKYGSNFKVSDLDFGIENFNLNSTKSKQQQSDEVIPIVWYLLGIARIIILSNMNEVYNFCRFDYLQMKNEIQPIIKKTENTLNNVINNLKEQLNELMKEYDPSNIFQQNQKIKLESLIKQLNDDKYIGISFDKFIYISQSDLQKIFTTNGDQFKFIDTFNPKVESLIKRGGIPKFFIDGTTDRKDIYNETVYTEDLKVTSTYSSEQLNVNLFDNDIFRKNFQVIVNEVVPEKQSELYISTSMNIITPRSQFSLTRLMMNFLLIYSKDDKLGAVNEPSELYDVTYTIHTKNVIDIPKIRKYNEYNYSFLNSESQVVSDSVLMWSEIEIVNDLLGVLFRQFEFPWEDKKYQKRLIRLIFMSNYIEMMYRDDLIKGINISDYSMNTIQSNYISELQIKINNLDNQSLQKSYNDEMEKLRETIRIVQNDIDQYRMRSRIKEQYVSNITSFSQSNE